ncbi:MAG: hypothetical protein IIY94_03720 [Oscillospiraceae bacterium]|nr:hypothetical protein [Oscillospiraceae bacterium]
MKKTVITLISVALGLLLLVIAGLLFLVSKLNPEQRQPQALDVYLAEQWKIFQLHSWDPTSGTLELDYPLRFNYEQMEKYGGSLEELQALPTGNLDTVASLKAALREATDATVQSITVYGLTTDGQVAYTVYPDGTITTCWDEP